MALATANPEAPSPTSDPALDISFRNIVSEYNQTAPKPVVSPAPNSVLQGINPAELARAVQVKLSTSNGQMRERLEGNRAGRWALRLGVVGGVAVAGVLWKTASAAAQIKYGVELNASEYAGFAPNPGEPGVDANNLPDVPNYETIGGRKVDMNHYGPNDVTRAFGTKDTVTDYAKDDLAVAARKAGVDDKHIDDLLGSKQAVNYIVDGYVDDTGNKGDIGKKLTVEPGTLLETDLARERADTLAVELNALEERLGVKGNDMTVKIADQKIDLTDYINPARRAEDWNKTGDSAWNWAEQDLAMAGRANGMTDKQIQDLIDEKTAKVTTKYIKSNESIQNHPRHYLMDGKTYDTLQARNHADTLAKQFLADLELEEYKKTHGSGDTPAGDPADKDDVKPTNHKKDGDNTDDPTIGKKGQSRNPDNNGSDGSIDGKKTHAGDDNTVDKRGQSRYPNIDHDKRAAKDPNATTKPWPIPNTDVSTSPTPVKTESTPTPTASPSDLAAYEAAKEEATKENGHEVFKGIGWIAVSAIGIIGARTIAQRLRLRRQTQQPRGDNSPEGRDPGPGETQANS